MIIKFDSNYSDLQINESDPQSPSASSSNSGGDTNTLSNLSNALFSSSKDENSEDVVGKALKDATQNMMDKIGSVTRMTGSLGGIAKFLKS